jgi:hypothetical protein
MEVFLHLAPGTAPTVIFTIQNPMLSKILMALKIVMVKYESVFAAKKMRTYGMWLDSILIDYLTFYRKLTKELDA